MIGVEQVLLESGKDTDIMGDALPNLIYLSREKNINSPHHFKAGALNTLVKIPLSKASSNRNTLFSFQPKK